MKAAISAIPKKPWMWRVEVVFPSGKRRVRRVWAMSQWEAESEAYRLEPDSALGLAVILSGWPRGCVCCDEEEPS
jgi:hypothetical protein